MRAHGPGSVSCQPCRALGCAWHALQVEARHEGERSRLASQVHGMEASLAELQQRCQQQEARAEQLAAAEAQAQSRLAEANFMIDQLKALLDGQAAALVGKVGTDTLQP